MQMILQKILKGGLLILLSFLVISCHKETTAKSKNNLNNTITVSSRPAPTVLYYSGTVAPVQVYNIMSPSDGAIDELYFKYGDQVKKGQLLMVVGSSKLQQDYRDALTGFLKAKEDYATGQINFKGSQELLKAQIISQQEFLSDKQQFDSTAIAYLNAKYQLEQQIHKLSGSHSLESLTLDNINTLAKVLQVHYNNIKIYANNDGIILYPQKNGGGDSSSGASNKPLQIGSQVKQGDILLSIGDLKGLTTTVPVSELVIDHIKTGLNVKVTLEAIPDVTLKGNVTLVGAQAQAAPGDQGGLATFPVTVTVPVLTDEVAKLVRVGMSAKVEITYDQGEKIVVPIAAVVPKNGQSFVTVLDPKTNKTHLAPVVTGHTTVTDVVITKGLSPGDVVVIP